MNDIYLISVPLIISEGEAQAMLGDGTDIMLVQLQKDTNLQTLNNKLKELAQIKPAPFLKDVDVEKEDTKKVLPPINSPQNLFETSNAKLFFMPAPKELPYSAQFPDLKPSIFRVPQPSNATPPYIRKVIHGKIVPHQRMLVTIPCSSFVPHQNVSFAFVFI